VTPKTTVGIGTALPLNLAGVHSAINDIEVGDVSAVHIPYTNLANI